MGMLSGSIDRYKTSLDLLAGAVNRSQISVPLFPRRAKILSFKWQSQRLPMLITNAILFGVSMYSQYSSGLSKLAFLPRSNWSGHCRLCLELRTQVVEMPRWPREWIETRGNLEVERIKNNRHWLRFHTGLGSSFRITKNVAASLPASL